MDNLENQPSPTPSQPGLDDLKAQLGSLASLLNSVLIMLLVLGGAVDLFLVRQVKNTRGELTTLRAYVAQTQRTGPAIDEFARKLAEFGKTHQDFAPIMTKYGLKPQAMTNALPAGGTWAPAAKKK